MLLSHWGYSVFVFSPTFTLFTVFCSFPPQPFLSRLIYPHHGDPEKVGVM